MPPSLKALDWLSSQTESSVAFPQFYLSVKHFENQPHELISSYQMVGVSGIGSAVHFAGSSSSEAHNSLKRSLFFSFYLSLRNKFIFMKVQSNSAFDILLYFDK